MVPQGDNSFTCLGCETMIRTEKTVDDLSVFDKVAYNIWKDEPPWDEEFKQE